MAAASASAAQLAVVAEQGRNQVSLISTATSERIGTPIGTGMLPTGVAITPDGQSAYVTNFSDDTVSVVEVGSPHNVITIENVGIGPTGVAITPNGRYAYVTDKISGEVTVISTRTKEVVKSIPVGLEPVGVAISPSGGNFAYVAEEGKHEGEVVVIDTETMTESGARIAVGKGPQGIEFAPGGTAFVVDESELDEVSAINISTREVTPIPLKGGEPETITISPDGTEAYVVGGNLITVLDTGTKSESGQIKVGGVPREVAFAANGKTAYVTVTTPPQVQRINVETGLPLGAPIALPGEAPLGIALTPDQSPVAVFTPPSATVGIPAPFNGSASTDADGSIASYNWTFEDGRDATGVNAVHTFLTAGQFNAKLTVVDDEGCGEAMVFTGRTAYCSGGASSVSHPVVVKAAEAAEATPPVCKTNFGVGGVTNNRKNGTVKLRVSLHTAGSIFLFGKKVHAVSRKTKAAGTMTLTIHARVELNKQLKKIHHARVPIRITFTPSNACGYKTVHRSIPLLRATKKHRH
ncbi:MAG TPA: PKD domain-containing protein [Solirubrobacterales bacterium]